MDSCGTCGRTGLTATVTFDKHDPVSILRALTEVCDTETLGDLAAALKVWAETEREHGR